MLLNHVVVTFCNIHLHMSSFYGKFPFQIFFYVFFFHGNWRFTGRQGKGWYHTYSSLSLAPTHKQWEFHREKYRNFTWFPGVEILRKLCLSAKFPYQNIRWNYGTFRSVLFAVMHLTLHKKWSFPLRISSVNMAKSAGNP